MTLPEMSMVRGDRNVILVAFPASWLSIEAEDTDGNRATGEHPETGRDVMSRYPGAVALLDGSMFELADGLPYATSQRARFQYRYLDRRAGVDVPSQFPQRGATLSVVSGRAVVLDGAAQLADATVAVQGYPEVIRGGRLEVTDARNTENTGRAALCLLSDGRVAFAVGRAPLAAFGRVLLALRVPSSVPDCKVRDALYTDGGDSTALALRGQGGALEIAHGLDARRLPAYLLAIPPASGVRATGPLPGEPERGVRAWLRSPRVRAVGAASAVGAILGGVLWWRRGSV